MLTLLSKLYKWMTRHHIIEEYAFHDVATRDTLRQADSCALRRSREIEFQNRVHESYYTALHRWQQEEYDRRQRQATSYQELILAKQEMEQKVTNLLKLLDDETAVRLYAEANQRPPQDPTLEYPYPPPTDENPRLPEYTPYKLEDPDDRI